LLKQSIRGDPVLLVISEMAQIGDGPAEDVRQVLSRRHKDVDAWATGDESPFHSDSFYARNSIDPQELWTKWSQFEDCLRSEARYYSRNAAAILNSVFEGFADPKTYDGTPITVDAGPNAKLSAFFRARVFQSDSRLKAALELPDIEIGPPPPLLACAGRMNPLGISVFYGATTPEIALGEVRPPVGSKVLIGRFGITRMLRLLDMEAVTSAVVTGSFFDPDFIERRRRANFLRGLSRRITRPVLPDDEPLDYLVTQAIADFLAAMEVPPLDGILYPSAQGGRSTKSNVVLFHKASRVQPLVTSEDTVTVAEFDAVYGDELETEYSVTEHLVADTRHPKRRKSIIDLEASSRTARERPDRRAFTLKLDVDSLEVRHVNRVQIDAEVHSVRWTKTTQQTL
jgi:hypothetical protein